MFNATRFGAAVALVAAISTFTTAAWADPEIVKVPGQDVTYTIPGIATPPIGPVSVATPPVTVPRTCAGDVFCAGPIDIPPQTIVNVPRVNPIGLTPPITLTVSTTDIVAAVNPTVGTLLTVPPTTVEIPNPFGGDPIPVDVCPAGCAIPGVTVVDGATGSVTLTACVGATCQTQTVPVQYGNTTSGQVCFTQASRTVAEGNSGLTYATLNVQRIGGTFNDAYVTYATQNGTAVAQGDYYAQGPTVLHWAHGEGGARQISIPIVGETAYENDETFSVALSNFSGAAPCAPTTAMVTITNDDNPPSGSLQFATGNYIVGEGGVSVSVEVRRVDGTFGTATATVSFAAGTAGSGDFVNPGPQQVTFTGSDTSETVTVFITDDSEYEPGADETFSATLDNIQGAGRGSPTTATIAIADNDTQPPSGSLQFGSNIYSVNEGGGSVSIEVVRVDGTYGTATATVSFSGQTAGAADFVNPGPQTVTFTGTQTSATVTVVVTDDTEYEPAPDETFGATLGNVSGASLGSPASSTVSIVDNDPPPDETPCAFSFPTKTGTTRNALIISDPVTINCLSVGASVTGTVTSSGSTVYGIDVDGDGNFQVVRTGIVNGSSIRVRHLSSSEFDDQTSTVVRVGRNPGTSGSFTSITRSNPGDECNPICP